MPPKKAARLRFIGSADSFVAGVPQCDLEVVDEALELGQVTPDEAKTLIASGLYVEDSSDG